LTLQSYSYKAVYPFDNPSAVYNRQSLFKKEKGNPVPIMCASCVAPLFYKYKIVLLSLVDHTKKLFKIPIE